MKIHLILIGKTDSDYLTTGVELYRKRITRYNPFEISVLPDLKNAKSLSVEELKIKEGELLLRHIEPNAHVILLDDKGRHFNSPDFARHLQGLMNRHLKSIIFVVGGAFGFSEAVYERGNERLSLSAMTFSHQLVRLVFAEQLYRAFSILNNEPYHHE